MKTTTLPPATIAALKFKAIAPVLPRKSDSVLKWAAGTAWLLSVWALVATAGAAVPGDAAIRTAIVPSEAIQTTWDNRGYDRPAPQTFRPVRTRQPIGYGGGFDTFNGNVNNVNNAGNAPGECRDCDRYRAFKPVAPTDSRRNYRELFDISRMAPTRDDYRQDWRNDQDRPARRPSQPEPFGRNVDDRYEDRTDDRFNDRYNDRYNAGDDRGFSTPQPAGPVYRRPNYDAPSGIAPGHRSEATAADKVRRRYGDPQVVRMGQRASLNEATTAFLELSDLIDRRHVSPIDYPARTRAALNGLVAAVESPEFLAAAGVSNRGTSQTAGSLRSLAQRPARSRQEAVGLMQQAARIVNRDLGVPAGMVGMEFVHATMDSLDRYSSLVPTSTAMLDTDDLPKAAAADGSMFDGLTRTAGLDETITGIGVEMKPHADGAVVHGTVTGGPAAAAGLARGDVITRIDGRSVGGMTLSQIADLVGGRAGTQVRLDVDRDGRTYQRLLTRRSIYVSSVKDTKMLDNGIGYARLGQFSASSRRDLEQALWSLHKQGMKGFVLDLRGNPGGLLTAAIEISDLFLPSGSIVSTRGRTAEDQSHERANFSKTWSTPLVVLIDGGSASASEIFAAAIQENDRGVIVGSRSYGKGTVQTHFPMRSLQANAKLTTAKFYSPKGREMAKAGVLPDVEVNADDDSETLAAATGTLKTGKPGELATLTRNGLRR